MPSTAASRPGGTRYIRTLTPALLVCAGYYAGSQLGIHLRLPPATPSVFWPPNAILTSALLLTSPRQWPIMLLAALPAHLIVELQTEWPLSLILSLFLTNCLEALIGAVGVRLLSDAPTRFDNFRRLGVFFAAVAVAAPFLSSFADASAVAWLHGESYWDTWRSRLSANMLAELTIVPSIVGVVTGFARWRSIPPGRMIEASVLAVGLALGGWIEFSGSIGTMAAVHAMSSRMPLTVELPFLLWAAVRFGVTGTSVVLLATSTISAWAVVNGEGPFASIDPGTTITAFRLSLIVVAVALMCLSTLIEERRGSQHELARRLRFEELLSRLSSAFVQLPSDQMDHALDGWLPRVGAFLKVDCLALLVPDGPGGSLHVEHYWIDAAAPGMRLEPAALEFPWISRRLLDHESIQIPDVRALPPDAARDRTSFEALGLRAAVAIPLRGDGLLGALSAGSVDGRPWRDGLIANCRLIGEVLAHVAERKRSEDALRRSEVMKSAILTSLTSGVVVVNRAGQILAHNESWVPLAREYGCTGTAVGGNLLEQLASARDANHLAAETIGPVSAVLEGSREQFIMEHASGIGANRRWWSTVVVPLNVPGGGAVVTHTDITSLRRAEQEVQRVREELAHVARVSMMGELTASIAHQLNQPLAAIRTNAQAAFHILRSGKPDLETLREILTDIVHDDRRASDVIHGLWDLLRKGQLEATRVNLTAAIREVADLITSECVIRNVTLSLRLEQPPAFVSGNRVQLQQVVLNLLQNAMEAMRDQGDLSRTMEVCSHSEGDSVHVTVTDSGPGIVEGLEEKIFDPFYTTKPGGMGMGLSIVRSIVEAHGGSIHAAKGRDGAVFRFTVPLDLEHAG